MIVEGQSLIVEGQIHPGAAAIVYSRMFSLFKLELVNSRRHSHSDLGVLVTNLGVKATRNDEVDCQAICNAGVRNDNIKDIPDVVFVLLVHKHIPGCGQLSFEQRPQSDDGRRKGCARRSTPDYLDIIHPARTMAHPGAALWRELELDGWQNRPARGRGRQRQYVMSGNIF